MLWYFKVCSQQALIKSERLALSSPTISIRFFTKVNSWKVLVDAAMRDVYPFLPWLCTLLTHGFWGWSEGSLASFPNSGLTLAWSTQVDYEDRHRTMPVRKVSHKPVHIKMMVTFYPELIPSVWIEMFTKKIHKQCGMGRNQSSSLETWIPASPVPLMTWGHRTGWLWTPESSGHWWELPSKAKRLYILTSWSCQYIRVRRFWLCLALIFLVLK